MPEFPEGIVKDGAPSLQRRVRRLARYEEVVRQHQHGMSIAAIAKTQQLDRKTVRIWLNMDNFPERAQRVPMPGKLTAYCSYLQQRWNAGCRNGSLLLREIAADQGYQGRLRHRFGRNLSERHQTHAGRGGTDGDVAGAPSRCGRQ
jgi:transposase